MRRWELGNNVLDVFGEAQERSGDRWNLVLGGSPEQLPAPSWKPGRLEEGPAVSRGGLVGGSELSSAPFE